jgi:hypothetical protein
MMLFNTRGKSGVTRKFTSAIEQTDGCGRQVPGALEYAIVLNSFPGVGILRQTASFPKCHTIFPGPGHVKARK